MAGFNGADFDRWLTDEESFRGSGEDLQYAAELVADSLLRLAGDQSEDDSILDEITQTARSLVQADTILAKAAELYGEDAIGESAFDSLVEYAKGLSEE